MSAIDLEWKDPPAPLRTGGERSTDYNALADTLRSNPLRWARVVRDGHQSRGSNVRSYLRLRGEHFEVRACRTTYGKADVYARFNPEWES